MGFLKRLAGFVVKELTKQVVREALYIGLEYGLALAFGI
jgi:hypothetical protein